jgi:NAD(P)-dependent dehydrogenase (short-subunit alcohol dehydrogenase family)
MKAFDKVDIIVNNAGTSQAMPFEKLTDGILHDDLELKLFAAIRLIRLVIPQMKQRRWGRIINVLNIGAKAPRPNSMPTSISRAAGMAMTKALSQELAPHNVLVNALLVGLVRADQHVQRAKRTNVPLEEYYKAHEKEIPIGRLGEAEEFANLACFLASEQGGYITGTAINVDGGRSPVV